MAGTLVSVNSAGSNRAEVMAGTAKCLKPDTDTSAARKGPPRMRKMSIRPLSSDSSPVLLQCLDYVTHRAPLPNRHANTPFIAHNVAQVPCADSMRGKIRHKVGRRRDIGSL